MLPHFLENFIDFVFLFFSQQATGKNPEVQNSCHIHVHLINELGELRVLFLENSLDPIDNYYSFNKIIN